ncbi:LVIVD repeat-containing protein [Bradyrhizobium genosp. P]|uniref:LVIVD repeat-containing protein n=1 Tax=Bradyrhizobium genosp. P TaxID=83641 RepID=UPI003CF09570
MGSQVLPVPELARNMRLIGHCDQGGRPDGVQLMVHRGFAYIGHMFSKGFSVVDVRDPTRPKTVDYVAAAQNTWNIHLQTQDDLLLVINAKDMFAASEFQDEKAYYKGELGRKVGTADIGRRPRDWRAGLAVYDISRSEAPREIGFMPIEGGGIHRLWYTGGRWAYASALIDGFTDYIFITIDMSDPGRPKEVGRYWLPGMNAAAGEATVADPSRRQGLHHPIVHGDTAYLAWRDAGMVILDVKDRTEPRLIAHKNWSPPFGGGTHNCLPLPDRDLVAVLDEAVLDHQEDGEKLVWLFDIREPSNPVSISTFKSPSDIDYKAKPGHFGPHNLHENRPGSFISSELIFATYQNAGVRVFDIRDRYAPREVGALVPPAPNGLVDSRPGRPRVIQSADVFVDASGLIYSTDYNGGLYVMEFKA